MNDNTHRILALTPPTQEGKIVLKEALYLQQTLNIKELFVLNIIKAPSFFATVFRTKNNKIQIENAKNELINFLKNEIHSEITDKIKISVKAGNIIPTILKEAKKGNHDFILVDKSKHGVLSKHEVNNLVSESECPVLTINKDFGVPPIKNIVIPIDISQTTKKRLLWATLFAKKYNAKITVLSALNTNIKLKQSLAHQNAIKIKHVFWDQNIECEIKIVKSHRYDKHNAILEYIKKEKPEMVIIRTHQDPLFANTNIGHFVSKIVHGCKAPVFTVNYTPNPFQSFF